MRFPPPRFSLLALLVLVLAAACGDKTRRDFAVCNTNPCQVGYVCLDHQCIKSDGGEDPSTRYPGWDSDGGVDIAGPDADAGKPDTGLIDRPTEAPSTCSNDNQCPIATPTCLASHCSKCGSDTDCIAHAGPACDVASGSCVQCTDAAKHCSTDPSKAFCVANTCAGCQTAGAGACTGNTPACDATSGTCVQCTGPEQCTADASKAFCVGKACAGCQAAGAGACKGATPACDGTSGTCVQCTGSDQCTADASKAFCVAKTCVGCQTAGAGACKGTTPVCDATSGSCVQCTTALQCAADATTAFCVAKACAGCSAAGGNPACASRGGGTPVCATSGLCVECATSADCTGDVTRPICDTSMNKCVPCATDAQCAAKAGGPGVCMFHDNKRCASDTETVYVENKTGCAVTAGAGAGTSAMPFCQAQAGVDAAVAGSAIKRIVVIRSSVDRWSATGSGTGEMTVVGQNNAVVAGGSGTAIDLSGGDFYLRGLTISGSAKIGVSVAAPAVIRLDRCIVKNNTQGGLVAGSGAGFDVANTVFDNNGPGMSGPISFGGVFLGTANSSAPSRFWYNTIVNNKQVGVVCEKATQSLTGLLLFQNVGGDVVNCALTSSKQTTDGDPKLTIDYHLTSASSCLDMGDPTSFPPDDIDGDQRPQGVRSDCGADELKP